MSVTHLKRFLNPGSISIHGGSWAQNVIEQLLKSNYQGEIWPVHPHRLEIAGVKCFTSIAELPRAPDAAFLGVNRELTIGLVRELRVAGAGGSICFASGFSESDSDQQSFGAELQDQLIASAGNMPLLGPNCYGYLNYLDNVSLWPDQHGGQPVDSGVAIIAQSSNVAINMTMQKRGLSLAYMFTVGNQACVGLNQLAEYALEDSRVTTLGLFIEGFSDFPAFEKMALKAKALGKSIVALKLGKSVQAQHATLSHTATLAGGSVASSAFLERLGIVEVNSLSCFIETLKLLDIVGPISGPRISSVSCSGGEASLIADAAHNTPIEFPELSSGQRAELLNLLGEKVTLANPLDYHTYVWGDVPTMTNCFAAVMRGSFDLNLFVLDLPRTDHCDVSGHRCAIDAVIEAKQQTQAKVAVITSLPENIDENITNELHQAGVVVLHGLDHGLEPIIAAVTAGKYRSRKSECQPVFVSSLHTTASTTESTTITEASAKEKLASYGVAVPYSVVINSKQELDQKISSVAFPIALKGLGMEHKSELGGVVLGIKDAASLSDALAEFPQCPKGYMLEQMVDDSIVEIIVGVTRDESGLLLLTLGAGGILTELISDSVSVLIPASKNDISTALDTLKVSRLLNGYRGKAVVNRDALLKNILAIQSYALDHAESLIELDVNPLVAREHDCYAVDALIRLG
jgi:acyl-CoA synthetase (NDP forming)